MKTITLINRLAIFVAFISLSYGASAQILSEDFNAGWPATWTTIDGDMATYNASLGWPEASGSWRLRENYDNAGVGDSAAVSSSWYDPITPADDWLITPQVTLGANSEVIYDEKAQDPSYPDGYELMISTTTPDAAGFNANPALYSVGAAANPAVQQTFSLAAYANQSVYLAWHNNSTDQYVLMIDNVVIQEAGAELNENSIVASAYPNPAVDVLNVTINQVVETISIISLDGKVVSTTNVDGTGAIVNVSDLAPGAYIYSVNTENGMVYRDSFVKK